MGKCYQKWGNVSKWGKVKEMTKNDPPFEMDSNIFLDSQMLSFFYIASRKMFEKETAY